MTRLLRPLRRLSSVLALAALAALAPLPAAAEGDTLAFTFDQVDVRLFSQVVGSFTGRKIVVGEDVEGKITVVSPEVSRDEAYALFAAVLESSGFTIVPEHGVDRVVKAPERPAGLGLGPVVSDGRPLPEHGLVTRVLAVEHVSAAEMRDLLEAQTQRKGAFAVLQETNHLVFTDTADAVRRVESLVKQLDKPGMARVTEVIEVEHADAGDLARELAASFAESQSRAQQLLGRLPASTPGAVLPAFTPPTIIPVEHANRLLVTGSGRQIQRVKELLAQLDVEAPAARAPLRPILLNYLRAEDLARNITTLLEKYAASNPDPAHARRIAVEASPLAGALLVAASSAEEFRAVEDLVRVLDVRPRQVHISVVIAEVQEGEAETLGFQFNAAGTYHGNAFGGGSHPNAETAAGSTLASVVGSQMFPEGLTAGIVNKAGTTIGAFNLDAIRQNAGVRILADPSISAENNVAAQVSIVDNIPMTESTVTGTGSDRDVVQTITRYDVGVKLSLTPHITPDGRVQMELEPSIEAVTAATGGDVLAPTISKRMVKTVQTARTGETIVIAGLTRSDRTTVRRRVPILGSIPLLGWLFRWDSEETRRTNILIFVTPTVVADDDAARSIRAADEVFTGLSAASIREELAASPLAADLAALHEENADASLRPAAAEGEAPAAGAEE